MTDTKKDALSGASLLTAGLGVGMDDREMFLDWLGLLLWHWQGDNPASADALAEKIMDVLDEHQKHASQVSAQPLPNAQALLRELGKPLDRTENPLPHECPDGFRAV